MVRSTAQFVLPRGFRVWRLLAIVALIGAALAVSTDHSQAEAPVDVVTTDTSFTLSWSADGEVKFYWWQPIARKLERVTVRDAKSWTATGLQPESEHEFSFFGAFYGSLKFKTKASGDPPPPPPPPPPTPEVSIAAGTDITEGGTASFTLTANPAPTSSITVSVSPSQSGDFGVGSTAKTVTITTSGTATVAFSTTNDNIDEPDGSVTASVDSGNGYTVSSSKGSATLAVADDDVPELSIASDGDVTEGTAASFTITASPTPHTALTANIDITATGSFGVTTGAQTVAISTSGSQSFTVSTSGDTTDEPNGTVTATLSTGSGYNVSSSAGTATATVSDDDDPPPPPTDPVVSIVAGSDITEGSDASFTVTITPEPSETMTVHVTVTQSGDFLPKDKRDVLIYVVFSMSSPHTFTVATTDDSTDEPDGSFTATITDREGYTVSTTNGVATVAVSDNDDPPAQPDTDTDTDTEADTTSATCELPDDAITADEITGWRDALDPNKAAAGVTRWNRTLEALGVDTGTGVSAMTADQAQNVADWLGNTRWDRTSRTLAAQDACDTEPPPPPPPADPEISISSSSDISEGGTVTFTLTATPAPTSDVDVSVSVTQSGSYTSQAGARTVTITSTGTASFTVTTLDDSNDEPDGSLTATVNTGTGYTVSSSASTITTNIADNDVPPLPEISISGGSDVAEGGNVSFTVTATPAPAAALDVSVTVTQSGSFTTQTGTQTVTILATGSTSFTVSTGNDATDEPDGSVTATIDTGTGYTVSTSAGATTVNVTDDDDTPQPAQQATPTITIADASADEGDMITFTVSVSPTHTADITVDYETVDGTAISHADVDDYSAASGSVTIAADTSSITFDVNTTEDDHVEIDDQFTINLSTSQDDVMIGNGTATGTILNDDTGTAGNALWQCLEWKKDTPWPGECLRRRLFLSIGDTYLANIGKDMNDEDTSYYASRIVLEEYYEPHEFGMYLRRKPDTTLTIMPIIANKLLVPFVPITPRYLVFTPENYSIPQKVSLHMLPDFNTRTEVSDLVAKVVEHPGAVVYGLYKQRGLIFFDRRRKPIEQERPATRVLHEGDSTSPLTYRLRLGARPTAGEDIVVTIKASPDKVNLSAATLTYTHDNWDVWQEVTITPKDDTDSDDEQVKVTVHIPVPGPQGPGPGHGPRIETFSLTVLDDDP